MTNTLPTKRAFLVAAGLANPTRGRFSAEAEKFAAENADKWTHAGPVAQAVVKTAEKRVSLEKAPKTVVQAKVALPQVNPKEVRAWAKQNGHEVGERGRIHGSVVQAFLAAGGKAVVPTAKRITPLDMPKQVRTQKVAWAVEPGRRGFADRVIARTTCGSEKVGCRKAIQHCTCAAGPVAPHWTDVAGKPLLLVKPLV